ncbi:MAG TPA: PEP-CTERM sorting domain-containing protein [Armatimonadota bacterium]|nr:PEP-CTERM sorting domain-containing protein [Armatimonadota bacterium]
MKKILLVSVVMLAIAAPALAVWDPLVNGGFESGLTGWYLRDGRQAITSLPQATPLVDTTTHPNQTWLGSEQPWAQVVDAGAARKLDVIEGYNSTTDPLFRNTGLDLDSSVLPDVYAGDKSVGWTRTGYRGIGGETHIGLNVKWDGGSWLTQYVYVKPGTYDMSAAVQVAADGANTAGDNKAAGSVHLEILGDPTSVPTFWHVDWYGDDEESNANKVRNTTWFGNSVGAWTAASVSGTVTTHTGWVELRIAFQEVELNTKGTSDPNIDGTEGYAVNALWAMVDSVTMSLPDEAIPEPSSMVALLTGLVGLGGLALRRRR